MNNDRADGGRGGGRGGGAGRGFSRGGRGGGRGSSGRRKWTSKHPDLKYDTFENGSAENAGQYTKTMKDIIEWIRISGHKEAEVIATAIEMEVTPTINPPQEPEGPEDPDNPGQRLPVPAVETAISQEEVQTSPFYPLDHQKLLFALPCSFLKGALQ